MGTPSKTGPASERFVPTEPARRWLGDLADQCLDGLPITRPQALAVLATTDADLLEVVAAAARVRRAHFGNRVKLNYLVNMKSGLCGEDCSYCSQRRGSQAGTLTYNWVAPEEAAAEAARAAARGARRVCLVASGRGPSERDLDRVADTVSTIRSQLPELEICVCIGILRPGQAERVKQAGAFAYNHNLNTAPSFYGNICSTHTFEERAQTARGAAEAGLSLCSGGIVGMGESDDQLVDMAFSLRELRPESVPVNFLMPFAGTPLAGRPGPTPGRCLRVLALFRFVFPSAEVRIGGGREMHLRSLQPLGLHIANSIFLGDYLTSEGAAGEEDLRMIADAGLVVEGAGDLAPLLGAPGSDHLLAIEGTGTGPTAPVATPSVRWRGVGTGVPGNV